MTGFIDAYFAFTAILSVLYIVQSQDIGWQCLSNECIQCSLSGTEPAACVYDGPGFYESKLKCQVATGCGPMKWQCKITAERGDKCSSCNTTKGARNACDDGGNAYMTQTECEVSSPKCGVQCPIGQVFTSCSTCEPSCDDPTTLKCSPWTCRPGCACPAGTFRNRHGSCVKADRCPQPEQKPCFNIVLQAYTQNDVAINKTTWPHSQTFFIPRCTEKGGFEKLQCFDQEGECLCVDPAIGIPVPGSKRKIDEGIPDCGDDVAPPSPPPPENATDKLQLHVTSTSETKCTKMNEEYADCVPSDCLPSCDQPNPGTCTADCWSGCICKPGYYRHVGGECVASAQCNVTTACRKQALAALDLLSSHSLNGTVPVCDRAGNFETPQCDLVSGVFYCWCVDPETGEELKGTKRIGRFICESDAEKTADSKAVCAANEVWDDCGAQCPSSCAAPAPSSCMTYCSPGCRCKLGYLVNEAGECVLPVECPPAKTKCIQAAYDALAAFSETENESDFPELQTCDEEGYFTPLRCTSSYCACIDKITGVEIPGTNIPNSAPPDCDSIAKKTASQFIALSRRDEIQCTENEVFEECATQCPQTCEQNAAEPCTQACVPGCQCKSGLVRHRDQCVPPSSCPTVKRMAPLAWQCNVDTEAKESCKSCGSLGDQCDDAKELFNSIEECEAKTPCGDSGPKCGQNEEFRECGSACPDTCANKNIAGPRPCTRQCVAGCFCRKGYRRSADGKCVEEEMCPSEELGQSYLWSCDLDKVTCLSCDEGNRKCDRSAANFGSFEQCMANGRCGLSILKCGPNEIFKTCGSSCAPTCEVPGPRICSRQCVPGCFCNVGFLRKRDGTCAKPGECPTPTKCLKEYLDGFKDGIAIGEFLPACESDGNYKRMQCHPSTGHCWCVEPEAGTEIEGSRKGPGEGRADCSGDAPQTEPSSPEDCEENEAYSECGSPCQATCEMPRVDGCVAACQKGCFCEPGHFRDDDGKCVHAKTCEASTSCRIEILEAYYEGMPPPGAFIPSCTPEGNYSTVQCHGSTGECWCVHPETGDKVEGSTVGPGAGPPDCNGEDLPGSGLALKPDGSGPSRQCKQNEEFNECGSACEPSCDNPSPHVCTAQCVIGCQCKTGFFRKDGECVPPDQCSPTADCHRLVLDAAKNGPIVGAYVPTCNKNGSYVPLQCHSSTGYCWCVNIETGEEIEGTKVRPGQGPPNCYGESTTAAPKDKESCEPETEEFTECGTSCEPSCSHPTPMLCTANCVPNVCHCTSGYFRNGDGKCVPPSQCKAATECHKKVFGAFEGDKAPPPGRFIPTCELDGSFTKVQCSGSSGYCWCADTTTGEKKEGTDVGPGRGQPDCGTQSTQDKESCDPKAETFMECGTSCEPSCAHPAPTVCTFNCVPNVCQCAAGYFRNKDGKCVPPSQCPAETECHKMLFGVYEGDKVPPPGRFIPTCETDGSFAKVQCSGSSGYCWCVEPTTGEKKEGTDVGPGSGRPDCGAPQIFAASRAVLPDSSNACSGTTDAYPDYCKNLVIAYKTAQTFCKWRGFKATCAKTCCVP